MIDSNGQFINETMTYDAGFQAGSGSSGGGVESGTADPNTDSTLTGNTYQQFDSNNQPVATWARASSSSPWYIIVQNQ